MVDLKGAVIDSLSCKNALVTSYADGGSVESYINSTSTIPVMKMNQIARDIAAGVLCLHSAGYIHRDIASRNALLTSNSVVQICDFGLSRRGTFMLH